MMIDSMDALKKVVFDKETGFEVTGAAFDFCNEIHLAQVSGSGAEWSIATTGGWLALVTSFNHMIHRLFMSQAKKDREDLKHVISKDYLIKKTTDNNKFELILRK